jgi:hypothetical protein
MTETTGKVNGSTAASTDGATPRTVTKDTAYRSPGEAAELLRADAGDLQADEVHLDRSGAEQIVTQRAILDRSGARTLDARSAQLDRSGAVQLKAENAVLNRSSAVVVSANHARLVRSSAFLLRAKETTIEGQVKTAIYAGGGDRVKALFDVKSAASLGVALGLMLMLVGRLLHRGRAG